MSDTKEKYSPEKLDLLLRYLQQQADKGAPRYFEIIVDHVKVVPRTNNVDEFDNHLEFINSNTKLVSVHLYSTSATSPRNEKHHYHFQDEQPKAIPQQQPQQHGLSGDEIENRLNEKLAQELQKWKAEQQQKELDEANKKLGEAEAYIDTLETQLTEYKSKKLHWGDVNLGELASVVVEGFVRRNPQLLAKIPGGEALAGIIEQDNKDKYKVADAQYTEASFSKPAAAEANPEHAGYIQLLQQLEAHFSQDDLNTIMEVLGALIHEPQHLQTIAELLGIKPTTPKP